MTDQTDPPVRVLRARWSLGYWLNIWLVGSLFGGVFLGTLLYYVLEQHRERPAAAVPPDPHA